MIPKETLDTLANEICWNEVKDQDVNSHSLTGERTRGVVDVLNKARLFNTDTKVAEVVCGRLIGNVELHEDSSFMDVDKRKDEVLLIVLDEGDVLPHTDSSRESYMYFNGKLERITKGDVLWFNARNSHAVFPRSSLTYLTVWFSC